ncbi:hypothetical protein DFH07DRAFT_786013 [Mycena maculata]|uniref:Uncharacterized protein n=1 Tax=Mycena maculata TaxID=230809 RepID=A0AAD7H537_9AGAR|nr:hypothetical protein DFH07DRAFT_786013 [Mycena maculata]
MPTPAQKPLLPGIAPHLFPHRRPHKGPTNPDTSDTSMDSNPAGMLIPISCVVQARADPSPARRTAEAAVKAQGVQLALLEARMESIDGYATALTNLQECTERHLTHALLQLNTLISARTHPEAFEVAFLAVQQLLDSLYPSTRIFQEEEDILPRDTGQELSTTKPTSFRPHRPIYTSEYSIGSAWRYSLISCQVWESNERPHGFDQKPTKDKIPLD